MSAASTEVKKVPPFDDPVLLRVREGSVVYLPTGAWPAGTLLMLERPEAESLLAQGVAEPFPSKDEG